MDSPPSFRFQFLQPVVLLVPSAAVVDLVLVTEFRYLRLVIALENALERQFKDGIEFEAMGHLTTRVRTGHLNSSYK
eukprot:gene1099-4327_t